MAADGSLPEDIVEADDLESVQESVKKQFSMEKATKDDSNVPLAVAIAEVGGKKPHRSHIRKSDTSDFISTSKQMLLTVLRMVLKTKLMEEMPRAMRMSIVVEAEGYGERMPCTQVRTSGAMRMMHCQMNQITKKPRSKGILGVHISIQK